MAHPELIRSRERIEVFRRQRHVMGRAIILACGLSLLAGRDGLAYTAVSSPTLAVADTAKGPEVTVYVTRTGKKYHRASCRYLAKSQIPLALSEAVARYSPCSVCKPPTVANAQSTSTKVTLSSIPASDGRCQAITKKGTRCKCSAKPGSPYCWQYGG